MGTATLNAGDFEEGREENVGNSFSEAGTSFSDSNSAEELRNYASQESDFDSESPAASSDMNDAPDSYDQDENLGDSSSRF